MKTTLYNIPTSEIPLLLDQFSPCHYWSTAADELIRWQGTAQRTDHRIGADPLRSLSQSAITGPVVINGITDQGITAELVRAIAQGRLLGLDQHWIIVTHCNEIPSDLVPLVELKTWALPSAAEVAAILEDHGCFSDALLRACLGLYRLELEHLLGAECPLEAVALHKKQKLMTRGILHIPEPHCEAVGLDNVHRLLDDVKQLLSPEADAAGLAFPKGMILLGCPGTGKSLVAKTAAQRLGIPLIVADWAGLLSPIPGQSEENLRLLLETAEVSSPSVVLWDDFDKAFVSSDLSQENGPEKRIAGKMLTWLQERTAKVFTIVTCNRITQLPIELKRRFDWHIHVDLPHEGSRFELFRTHLGLHCDVLPEWSEHQWKDLITAYSECTPDEIGKAVYHCAIQAFLRGQPRRIAFEDLLVQRQRFTPANIANPEPVSSIRRHSRHYLNAASADKSQFKITRPSEFVSLLESGGGYQV